MDAQAIATWVQTGGLVALAVVMTVLHVYDLRHTFPEMQQQFHLEIQREREVWAAELHQVRTNTERRQREMIQELRDALEPLRRRAREGRREQRMEDGGDTDAES